MTREEIQKEIQKALAPLATNEEQEPIVQAIGANLGAILFDRLFVPSVVKQQIATHVKLTDWDDETRAEYEQIFNAEYEACRVENLSLEDLTVKIRSLESALSHDAFVRKTRIAAHAAFKANKESVASAEDLKKAREFDKSSALKEAALKTEKKGNLTKKQQQMQTLVKLGVKFDDAKDFMGDILKAAAENAAKSKEEKK